MFCRDNVPYFVDRRDVEILSIDERLDQFQKALAYARISGHDAGLCECETFECFPHESW
jgi:hypothetical protein